MDDVLRCDNRVGFRPGRRAYTKCSRCGMHRWVVIDKDKDVTVKKPVTKTTSSGKRAGMPAKAPASAASTSGLRCKLLLTRSQCLCDKSRKDKARKKDLKSSPGRRRIANSRAVPRGTAVSPHDAASSSLRHTYTSRRRAAAHASSGNSRAGGGGGDGGSAVFTPHGHATLRSSIAAAPKPSPASTHSPVADEFIASPPKHEDIMLQCSAEDEPMNTDEAAQDDELPQVDSDHGDVCCSPDALLPSGDDDRARQESECSYESDSRRSRKHSQASLSSWSEHTMVSASSSEDELADEGLVDSAIDSSGLLEDLMTDDGLEVDEDLVTSTIAAASRTAADAGNSSTTPTRRAPASTSHVACTSETPSALPAGELLSDDSFASDGSTLTPGRMPKRRHSGSASGTTTPCAATRTAKRVCSASDVSLRSPLIPSPAASALPTPHRTDTHSPPLLRTPSATTRHSLSIRAATPSSSSSATDAHRCSPLACSTPSVGSNRSATPSPMTTPLARPHTRSCTRRSQLFVTDGNAAALPLPPVSSAASPVLSVLQVSPIAAVHPDALREAITASASSPGGASGPPFDDQYSDSADAPATEFAAPMRLFQLEHERDGGNGVESAGSCAQPEDSSVVGAVESAGQARQDDDAAMPSGVSGGSVLPPPSPGTGTAHCEATENLSTVVAVVDCVRSVSLPEHNPGLQPGSSGYEHASTRGPVECSPAPPNSSRDAEVLEDIDFDQQQHGQGQVSHAKQSIDQLQSPSQNPIPVTLAEQDNSCSGKPTEAGDGDGESIAAGVNAVTADDHDAADAAVAVALSQADHTEVVTDTSVRDRSPVSCTISPQGQPGNDTAGSEEDTHRHTSLLCEKSSPAEHSSIDHALCTERSPDMPIGSPPSAVTGILQVHQSSHGGSPASDTVLSVGSESHAPAQDAVQHPLEPPQYASHTTSPLASLLDDETALLPSSCVHDLSVYVTEQQDSLATVTKQDDPPATVTKQQDQHITVIEQHALPVTAIEQQALPLTAPEQQAWTVLTTATCLESPARLGSSPGVPSAIPSPLATSERCSDTPLSPSCNQPLDCQDAGNTASTAATHGRNDTVAADSRHASARGEISERRDDNTPLLPSSNLPLDCHDADNTAFASATNEPNDIVAAESSRFHSPTETDSRRVTATSASSAVEPADRSCHDGVAAATTTHALSDLERASSVHSPAQHVTMGGAVSELVNSPATDACQGISAGHDVITSAPLPTSSGIDMSRTPDDVASTGHERALCGSDDSPQSALSNSVGASGQTTSGSVLTADPAQMSSEWISEQGACCSSHDYDRTPSNSSTSVAGCAVPSPALSSATSRSGHLQTSATERPASCSPASSDHSLSALRSGAGQASSSPSPALFSGNSSPAQTPAELHRWTK